MLAHLAGLTQSRIMSLSDMGKLKLAEEGGRGGAVRMPQPAMPQGDGGDQGVDRW